MRLPIAPRDTNWDGSAAEGRICEYTGSTDAPSSNYRKFFMFFDQANADQFTAYKLPFADIINGKPHVIPAAISAIQGALSGARGGVDIPDADKQRIQDFVTAYQARIDGEQRFRKEWIEQALRKGTQQVLLTEGLPKIPGGCRTITGVDLGVKKKASSDPPAITTILEIPQDAGQDEDVLLNIQKGRCNAQVTMDDVG